MDYNIRKNVNVGIYNAYGVSALVDTNTGFRPLIALSFIERSKVLSKAIVASINSGESITINHTIRSSSREQEYYTIYKKVTNGRDSFNLVTVLNKAIGTRYLLTDAEHKYEDMFNFLMINYKLPLLREWIPEIENQLLNFHDIRYCNGYGSAWECRVEGEVLELPGIVLHGKNVRVNDVIAIDFNGLNDATLKDCVSDLIKRGVIKVSDEPSEKLVIESLDGYIQNYGPSLVRNLEESIETLSPLNGELDGFAAKTKRLYPQQAACVNGIIALKKAGSKYGLMVEGMGCGKTLQGAAVADAYFNQKWLENHKGKSLKDLYMSKDQPKYRNVLMAPSHLVSKWKDEILSEIPGSTVTIIDDFEQLIKLRAEGKERKGREWYLISKDFCKLGSQLSPIPTNVAKMVPKAFVCQDCLEEAEKPATIYKEPGKSKCSRCGGRNFRQVELYEFGEQTGLVCPKCGGLLMRPAANYFKKEKEEATKLILTPADFASHTSTNDTCMNCGEHLWGVDCKPIGVSQEKDAARRKWYKVSHYKNFQKKGRTTAFVLKGHESDYLAGKIQEDMRKSPVEYGPRRYAPSLYIKKYLKGFFDFTILDEAHKYEAGGSAQSIAAHALMLASSFTLCLTGTISNGKADSFFYLLYMLDPRRMKKKGYDYNGVMDFARQYGCVETVYEAKSRRYGYGNDDEDEFRSMSKGRVIKSPRIKPGISPLLFTDFLLDKAVFLDLSDLSSYLPKLKEEVVLTEEPDNVKASYSRVIDNLKTASKEKGGRALLSTMLQFGLSYPDKPYGYNPIMHPLFADTLVTNVPSHDEYVSDNMSTLLPKEEKLIEIVQDEIAQDRNCFIYCAYTGNEEMNITGRLQTLVEEKCNLKGQVLVMNSTSPVATKREEFIRQKASEGIKVFICNMKLVETGLDFCFKYNGAHYNYPTIIFYQLTYELAVMWQASRRHYRLNQTEECHTYYMATEGTLQQLAIQIMAEKQVAASAIQGKFSADGLTSMAKGIDPRLKMAQMLAEGDSGKDRKSLENMFDVMNASNNSSDDNYVDYIPPKTFYEVMDGAEMYEEHKTDSVTPIITSVTTVIGATTKKSAPKTKSAKTKSAGKKKVTTAKKVTDTTIKVVDSASTSQMPVFDIFGDFEPVVYNDELTDFVSKKPKKAKAISGQVSIFDLAA
ncbi:DEAD/DEAH box helicase [Butyrivibrio proteoclasticus]|uniref:DEAD/DEAH box helicase n=1 Tax=Butyrivibrio proteoclasticus TaxID=43305 RepID=UPI00047AAB16|nr:DEAD/DEAH box helicase [Butyrivibrio proteoclasticus]